eukprot:6189742-Pleurochrysis_carterae.AAC.3
MGYRCCDGGGGAGASISESFGICDRVISFERKIPRNLPIVRRPAQNIAAQSRGTRQGQENRLAAETACRTATTSSQPRDPHARERDARNTCRLARPYKYLLKHLLRERQSITNL